ncbi:MAG: SAP domain-containing protein, partial [Candidatus Poseidoniales archaeon]
MGDEPTTTLTVAKLKALCVLNDVSASGKKAELLARLLEAGVDKETLGIEVYDESTATFQPAAPEEGTAAEEAGDEGDVADAEAALEAEIEADDESNEAVESDEPVMLSLEDDDAQSVPLPEVEVNEDEVLEAEILE